MTGDGLNTEGLERVDLKWRLEAVLELHQPTGPAGWRECMTCMGSLGANQPWPCDTVRAVRGES